jgi:hypothetical protein
MAKFRVVIRETYTMIHEADTPAQAGEKAMECMNDHPDQHILMQEMQFIPYDDDDEDDSWEKSPQWKEMH